VSEVRQLDCSGEATAPRTVSSRPGKWLAADIADQDWKIFAGEEHRAEIDAMAATLTNGDTITRKPVHCLQAMQKMQRILNAGVGFAVFDRLPVEKYPTEILVSKCNGPTR